MPARRKVPEPGDYFVSKPIKKKALPSREFLRASFDYDPETGILTWKVRRSNNTQIGKEAGTTVNGYRQVKLDQFYYVHRIIWKMITGEDPDEVDHIDGDRANNKISNLRAVDRLENRKNIQRHSNNTSGVLGVSFHRLTGKWQSYITVRKRRSHIGLFDTFEEAVAARKAAEAKLMFHENHGREPA